MLKSIMEWFKNEPEQATKESCPTQRAAAALMIEVAYADHEFDAQEAQKLPELLRAHTGLTTQESLELMEIAKQEVDIATSLHQFTRHLNQVFSIEEKTNLLTTLWSVAYADGNIDKYEDHIIRRIADLLHLRHSEFVQAKHEAQAKQS